MIAGFQPYGRVNFGGDRRRGINWNLPAALLIILPIACLVLMLYELHYLQKYASSDAAVDASAQDSSIHQRVDKAAAFKPTSETKDSPNIINGRTTIVLVANYRDSARCSETLRSLFDNAVEPDNIKISIYDQIYPEEKEISCAESFCELVGEAYCRRSQIVSSQINAINATGPTAARYEAEKAITDEDFCMAIDSHLVFAPDWDAKIIAQWDSVDNPNAIITVYPKPAEYAITHDAINYVQLMCLSRIESDDLDSMVQFAAPTWIKKKDTPKPRLMSQLAGGFNFGSCQQVKEVRNDPYTPYLFHGEEYSRAARLWTAGYDFYVPSDDIAYHWYEKRNLVWERNWNDHYAIQQQSKRRIRYILGLPVTKEGFDRTDLDKFTLGTKRTFEQWKNFSGIDPLAKFVASNAHQFNNCRELEYVPY